MSKSNQSEEESINDDQCLLMNGFNEAIIGFGSQAGAQSLAIYSYDKMLDICMRDNDFTVEDANEFLAFNALTAYMGKGTPIIMTTGPEALELLVDVNESDPENTETSS